MGRLLVSLGYWQCLQSSVPRFSNPDKVLLTNKTVSRNVVMPMRQPTLKRGVA
jgi:hypothetical protein